MNSSMLIADLFHRELPIDWCKWKMYHEEDHLYQIPYLLFRLEDGKDEKYIPVLIEMLGKFKGKRKWVLVEHYRVAFGNYNYLLTISDSVVVLLDNVSKCINVTSKELYPNYEQLCEEAIADIPALYEYLLKEYIPLVNNDWSALKK